MADAEVKQTPENEKDLPSFKSKLEELRNKKEEWFKKKEDLKLDIANLIKQIKALKGTNDTSSRPISGIKSDRDKCNSEVH